eukprot:gb/GECH01007352.1/.p1 GENE.gb/GECH01007352.1/~~gb/GECH01007352.1/.p1  ORF type:complete len:213 (+),score=42.68 gb/GECH01007352.1/:1-639(+)
MMSPNFSLSKIHKKRARFCSRDSQKLYNRILDKTHNEVVYEIPETWYKLLGIESVESISFMKQLSLFLKEESSISSLRENSIYDPKSIYHLNYIQKNNEDFKIILRQQNNCNIFILRDKNNNFMNKFWIAQKTKSILNSCLVIEFSVHQNNDNNNRKLILRAAISNQRLTTGLQAIYGKQVNSCLMATLNMLTNQSSSLFEAVVNIFYHGDV